MDGKTLKPIKYIYIRYKNHLQNVCTYSFRWNIACMYTVTSYNKCQCKIILNNKW